jgi:predicted ribosomally synthesized peptide with SipW-like signal peptide
MKNILLSSAIITALVAVAIGSTVAAFNDQGVVAGNTVAAGTLELTLNESAGKPFNITNAYPGYMSDWELIDIYNTGTLPFEAYMSFNKTGGDLALYKKLTIELKTSGWDSDCLNGDGGENTIYNGLIKDFTPSTLVSSLNFWHLASEEDGSGSPADNIQAGYSERVCQRVGVDPSAGNAIMGTSVTFDEIVDAMQDND